MLALQVMEDVQILWRSSGAHPPPGPLPVFSSLFFLRGEGFRLFPFESTSMCFLCSTCFVFKENQQGNHPLGPNPDLILKTPPNTVLCLFHGNPVG